MSDFFENDDSRLQCEEQLTTKLFAKVAKLEAALERIRDCDWPGPLPLVPSRADWMQQVAKNALEGRYE